MILINLHPKNPYIIYFSYIKWVNNRCFYLNQISYLNYVIKIDYLKKLYNLTIFSRDNSISNNFLILNNRGSYHG